MTKKQEISYIERINQWADRNESPNDENESPEYIVKLLMTKTSRKLALYRENKSMTEMNHPMMKTNHQSI